MGTYSYSKLISFDQCRQKYKFRYIDKIKPEIKQTIEAFLGSIVHMALETLYQKQKQLIILSKNQLVEAYNLLWEQNWEKEIIIVKKDLTKEDYQKKGKIYLTQFHDQHYPFNRSKTIILESQKLVPLNSLHKFHIRIDRLAISPEKVFEIHDYKTTNTLPTQKELDQDEQLGMYAYGIKHLYPEAKSIDLIWHFLVFGKELRSTRSSQQLIDIQNKTLRKVDKIETCTVYPTNPSKLCNWCEFKPICPEYQ